MRQRIIHTSDTPAALAELRAELRPDNVLAVADRNTARYAEALGLPVIVVEPGDEHKTLDAVATLWEGMHDAGLTRHSLVVNVGGGMVTDLGGFAAATYRRGIRFVNVPTTLLGAVDAACGGKTGFNHCGVKNHIGVFAPAEAVIVNTDYFRSLPKEELLSGYAEMLKHALLSDSDELAAILRFDPLDPDWELLPALVAGSMATKQRIVDADPLERGLRKALNLGHTAGHALESLAIGKDRPIPHGYAVAYGLVVALVLSVMTLKADSGLLHRIASRVRGLYGAPDITCADYDRLTALMLDDKKNRHDGLIRFTLLTEAGKPHTDCPTEPATVVAALDIARDLFGI
ncbi:MAG: 3-dehydroquinate synthase [Paramuribaculum sp.]|nr:3-dehydroquinate synthase [Paramuribaculum sp.]